jgi:hypothetical protein
VAQEFIGRYASDPPRLLGPPKHVESIGRRRLCHWTGLEVLPSCEFCGQAFGMHIVVNNGSRMITVARKLPKRVLKYFHIGEARIPLAHWN